MELTHLRVLHFRSYQDITIELPVGGALFVGRNGSGKTNLLEAIGFSILGRSVRGASVKQLITNGKSEAFVEGTFSREEEAYKQSVGFSLGGKVAVKRKGVDYSSLSALYGEKSFLYFGPTDIELVTGSPGDRRRFLDMMLSQIDSNYLRLLMEYRSVLGQRNKLLSGAMDTVLLGIYTEQLAERAAYLMACRAEYCSYIAPLAAMIYKQISGGDFELSLSYAPSLKVTDARAIVDVLKQKESRDSFMRYTTTGPHRDDLKFLADGSPVMGFGSQGQCRSAALALKIATLDFLQDRSGSKPIIAVDDAFSDLDEGRKRLFYSLLENRGQCFIAVHTEDEASYYDLPAFSIEKGRVLSYGI